jgi:hypothetical protein
MKIHIVAAATIFALWIAVDASFAQKAPFDRSSFVRVDSTTTFEIRGNDTVKIVTVTRSFSPSDVRAANLERSQAANQEEVSGSLRSISRSYKESVWLQKVTLGLYVTTLVVTWVALANL